MRLCLIAVAAALLLPALSHADVMYSYVGAGDYAGTSFTIDSPTFLSYSFDFIPVTTSSDLIVSGFDDGKLASIRFTQNVVAGMTSTGGTTTLFFGAYNIAQNGIYVDNSPGPVGTLTISGAPSAVAVTPEPSSLALLGTGILGVAGVVRKRLA